MKPRPAIILFILSVGISLAFLYYRRPDAFKYPQFYAEDATIFFTQAYYEGAGSINNIYSGYLHTYERVVAITLEYSGIPYKYFPLCYIIGWLLPLVYCIYLLFYRLGLKTMYAFFVSLLPALMPVHTEAILNLTNVQWILCACVAMVAIAKSPAGLFGRVVDWVFIFLAVTSSPIGIFLTIIFIYSWRTLKQHPGNMLVSITGQVIQMHSMFHSARYSSHSLPFNSWFLKANRYVFNQFSYPFVGLKEVYRPDVFYYVFSFLVILILIISFMYFVRKKNHPALIVLFMLCATIVLNIFASVKTLQSIHPMFGNMRYFYLPSFFMFILIFIGIKNLNIRIMIAPVLMIWITCINMYIFGRTRYPDLNWSANAQLLQKDQKISAPVLPGFFWKLELDPAFHRK